MVSRIETKVGIRAESSFRMWVFGFAMERRLASIGSTPARLRSLLGRSWGYSTRRCGPVVGAIAGFDGYRISTPLAVA